MWSPVAALRTIRARLWCVVVVMVVITITNVSALDGSNVCMVKQKYNITKRVKYQAPMSIRTYEWCFSMPPRCSRWNTEMRDLTKLETEERTAEVAICCPGYKMKDVSCVPICPNGKTGPRCSEDCPPKKWGPNCVHDCANCSERASCSPESGECVCQDGWQGESCEIRMTTTRTPPTLPEEILTTTTSTTKTSSQPSTKLIETTVSSTTLGTTTVIFAMKPNISSSRSFSVTTTSPFPSTSSFMPITTTRQQSTAANKVREVIQDDSEYYRRKSSERPKGELLTTTSLPETPMSYNTNDNITFTTSGTSTVQETTPRLAISKSIYNRTETSVESFSPITTTEYETTTNTISLTSEDIRNPPNPSIIKISPTSMQSTVSTTEVHHTTRQETSKKPQTIGKVSSSSVKFKPKEIWIKPTQKGESTIIDFKVKPSHELSHSRHRGATKKDLTSEFTTPRTIIVSIIPTSVSYATFKKIALTTITYLTPKNVTAKSNNTNQETTYSITSQMSLPPTTFKRISTTPISINISATTTTPTILIKNITKLDSTLRKAIMSNLTVPISRSTNSMSSMGANTLKLNFSDYLTTVSSSTNSKSLVNHKNLINTTVSTEHNVILNKSTVESSTEAVIKNSVHNHTKITMKNATTKHYSKTKATGEPPKLITLKSDSKLTNHTRESVAKIYTKHSKFTTEEPREDETFHILTEPEHITAVMSDKEHKKSSMDLISVISIAGGVMMAVITVAVLIVMIERCKRPRFEDMRKINDIGMQVMIDNNDVPPPYVRSIFHTPLPEPPSTERCHYQPISTLDRNLKQFMRPVVVQTISPIMLENFRGILECHYDHLPRRNHDFGTMPSRFTTAPSMNYNQELRCPRAKSVTDSAIEALKCEAKLDVIDSTTSEPLYAEIPCWRPPSEHAIAVVNLNGEAITEL